MVEAAAALADGADPPRARTVAGIPGARRGMSFVATHSVQGSWIVGVGGKEGNTVIYDPSAMKTFEGPEVSYPKHQPILISLDSKVYAISRRPTVYDKKYDFVPWFESLSFKKGVPGISGEKFSFWKALPPPPFFPFMLDPLEYCNPPTVSVSSYAAFGSHILLSPDCKETGTYAFHVVEETWEKVCNNNMPFVGQAVALGGGLFAACSTIHNNFATAAIVFRMSIIKGSSIPGASVKLIVRSLSTLPLASMGDPPLPLLCPAGKGSFCSIKLGQGFCEGKDHVQIILTAFKIDNIEAVLTASQTEHADASVLQLPVEVHHQNQTYLLEAPFPFKNPCMPVIALLSM
ncbi:hypothetical protein PR202_ga14140 [Eleusine coracana subsp. coracana]|uniref:Uncharacterized protein n=1 Tax=Eleusine coracana subsp. coracana TaxID=191504 RepID=A0AAV5CGF4_ELECO|nr:hypothetical protein PR202_ga14140 [Eleusine coracana subsp. coracana]